MIGASPFDCSICCSAKCCGGLHCCHGARRQGTPSCSCCATRSRCCDARRSGRGSTGPTGQPWDGADLWVAHLGPDGQLGPARHVVGGPHESVVQPEWSAEGSLHFVSDRSGWWNLYRERDGQVEPLLPMAAE